VAQLDARWLRTVRRDEARVREADDRPPSPPPRPAAPRGSAARERQEITAVNWALDQWLGRPPPADGIDDDDAPP
jgi:hypothetical protein